MRKDRGDVANDRRVDVLKAIDEAGSLTIALDIDAILQRQEKS